MISVSSAATTLHDRFSSVPRSVLVVVFLGVVVRLVFWGVYPPVWKLFAAFNFIDLSAFDYLGSFTSYKPTRMPFYDAIISVFYRLLGVKSLTLFSTLLTAVSLPFLYGGVRRLFDREIALYSLVLYAFYPKFIVSAAIGMPESTSVAFLAVALYGVVQTQSDDGGTGWALLGGLALLCSFLMYVPAVVAAVLLSLYSSGVEFARHRRGASKAQSLQRFVSSSDWVAVVGPSLVGGMVYLIWGPIRDLLNTGTGSARTASLFVDPAAYSSTERVVRYLMYVFYDFWWHGRGFDHEGRIVRSVSSTADFLGSVFPVYMISWVVITAVLTILLLLGFVRLLDERHAAPLLFVSWASIYVALFTVRNLGWAGALQTRHVFPVIPALCLAFGVGVARTRGWVGTLSVPQRLADHSLDKVSIVGLHLLFAILLINGLVFGYFIGQNASVSDGETIAALEQTVGDDTNVAVLDAIDYRHTVLYSGGDVRPIILVPDSRTYAGIQYRSTIASVHVETPGELDQYDVDYLFVRGRCTPLTDRDAAFIDGALEAGGTMAYNEIFRGTSCKTPVHIVRLDPE